MLDASIRGCTPKGLNDIDLRSCKMTPLAEDTIVHLPATPHRVEGYQITVDTSRRVSLARIQWTYANSTRHDPPHSLLMQPSPRLSWAEFLSCTYYFSGKLAPVEGLECEANSQTLSDGRGEASISRTEPSGGQHRYLATGILM